MLVWALKVWIRLLNLKLQLQVASVVNLLTHLWVTYLWVTHLWVSKFHAVYCIHHLKCSFMHLHWSKRIIKLNDKILLDLIVYVDDIVIYNYQSISIAYSYNLQRVNDTYFEKNFSFYSNWNSTSQYCQWCPAGSLQVTVTCELLHVAHLLSVLLNY